MSWELHRLHRWVSISEYSQLPHGLAPGLAQGTSVEMPTGFKGTHHSAGVFDMILEILRALKALRQ